MYSTVLKYTLFGNQVKTDSRTKEPIPPKNSLMATKTGLSIKVNWIDKRGFTPEKLKDPFTEKDVENDNIDSYFSETTEQISENKMILYDGSFITDIRITAHHETCPAEEDEDE